MAKTLIQVQQQIQELQHVAAQMRQAEVDGVIARIKEAIAAYDLSPADLFGAGRAGAKRAGSAGRVAATRARSKSRHGAEARYADGTGNEWVGRGPRPKWLREAIANGRSLDEFAVAGTAAAPSRPARAPREAVARKRVVPVKYRSGDDTWTGRGSRPRWVREALEQGKSLEDFLV